MSDEALRRELDRLRRRVEVIERRLEIGADETPGEVVPPSPAEPTAVEPPPLPADAPPGTKPTVPVTAARDAGAAGSGGAAAPPTAPRPIAPMTTAAPPTFRPSVPSSSVPPPPPSARAPRSPLELLVGGKLAAWVGAIVVVIGAGLLVKVGIDAGLWGKLSPVVRCLLVAAFGGVLLAGGELALRRISRAASVGLFGAGLGVLYLDAYASWRVFEIVSPQWAFVLMAIVAAGGIATTLHTRFLTIGVLSLVGGYVTPLLLRGVGGHHLELMGYLTALLGVALGLSAADGRFRALRGVALGGQSVVALAWLLMMSGAAQWLTALVFFSVWWTMILGEAVFVALRGHSARTNAIGVLVTTALYVTAGAWLLHAWAPTGPDWLGLFTLAIGVLCATVAFQFGPGVDGLRRRPRTAMEALALTLWAQAGVLVVVAVALQFDGFGQSIAWLAVGLAAIELGRRLEARGLTGFGLTVGVLAGVRIALVDWWATPGFSNARWSWPAVDVSDWSILALVGIAFAHVAAHRLRGRITPIILTAVAAGAWIAVATVQCRGLAVTGVWLLGSVALLGGERFARRQRALEIALVAIVLTAIRWVVVDAAGHRFATGWDAGAILPFLNARLGLAIAIAAAGAWAARRLVRVRAGEAAGGVHGPRVIAIVGAFMLVALSFEVDRMVEAGAVAGRVAAPNATRHLLLTILWALGATAIGLLPERGARRPVRAAAWIVLLFCAAKWAVYDAIPAALGGVAAVAQLSPLANLQLAAGLLVATGLVVLANATGRNAAPQSGARLLAGWTPVAAVVLLLWGLTFEIDRAVVRADAAGTLALAPEILRALWWTALWAIGATGMMIAGRWRRSHAEGPPLVLAGAIAFALAAVAWLVIDTLGWRLARGPLPTPIIVNLQCGIGLGLLALVILVRRLAPAPGPAAARDPWTLVRIGAGPLVGVLGLWLGTLEIDRGFADARQAAQALFSAYWAVYGVALVVVGFARRWPLARHAGLALLAATVAKVVLVDLGAVEGVWRAFSFLAAGLLLLGTSVLYIRLSPRLLGATGGESDAPP